MMARYHYIADLDSGVPYTQVSIYISVIANYIIIHLLQSHLHTHSSFDNKHIRMYITWKYPETTVQLDSVLCSYRMAYGTEGTMFKY